MTSWHLRYAAHLGYMRPDAPLLRHSAGSADPVAHVEAAADLGFAGMQDVWAVARPLEEQRRIGAAMERRGLEGGCVAVGAREHLREPLWATPGAAARDRNAADLAEAIAAAKRINSRLLVLISGAQPGVPLAYQHAVFVEHLKWAAELAAREGMTLCVEPINGKAVPNMILHHVADAFAVVRAVDNPAVKMIFDTGHIQAMDGDLLAHLDTVWSEVALFQIADNPGRQEPGTGELNFANILKAVAAKGYRGLVECEHDWSDPGAACERRGLANLRALDAAAVTS